MASDSTTSSFATLSLQRHALIETRGPERPGRMCGMGLGPMPTQVFEARAFSAEDPRDEEMRSIRSGLSELKKAFAEMSELLRHQNLEAVTPTHRHRESK